MTTTTPEDDLKFLKSELKRLERERQLADLVCEVDLRPQEDLQESSDDEVRCACISGYYGFDGDIFLPSSLGTPQNIREGSRIVGKQINLICQIIAIIERSDPDALANCSWPLSRAEQSNGIGQHTDRRQSVGEPRELIGQQDAGDKLYRLVTRSDVAKLIPDYSRNY
jgi:hypothetical protein